MALSATKTNLYSSISGALVPDVLPSLSTEFYGGAPDPENSDVMLIWPGSLQSGSVPGVRSLTWVCAIGVWRESVSDLNTAILGMVDALNELFDPKVAQCGGAGGSGPVQLESLQVSQPMKAPHQAYSSTMSGVSAVVTLVIQGTVR